MFRYLFSPDFFPVFAVSNAWTQSQTQLSLILGRILGCRVWFELRGAHPSATAPTAFAAHQPHVDTSSETSLDDGERWEANWGGGRCKAAKFGPLLGKILGRSTFAHYDVAGLRFLTKSVEAACKNKKRHAMTASRLLIQKNKQQNCKAN